MIRRLLILAVCLLAFTARGDTPDPEYTTLSYRFLNWVAHHLPGHGNWNLIWGALSILIAVHVLQIPFLVKLSAALRSKKRSHIIWIVLAIAFTELVPLGWSCATGKAWLLAFHVNGETAGNLKWPTIILYALVVGGIVADSTHSDDGTWVIGVFVGIFWLVFTGLSYVFEFFAEHYWINEYSAPIGAFMFATGTVPLGIGVAAAIYDALPLE